MERPSPVPPLLRVREGSSCRKASNIASSLSSGMPTPVSSTQISTVSPAFAADTLTYPASVYFKAFPTRLYRIWSSLFSSA
jgi:hypothetical protein